MALLFIDGFDHYGSGIDPVTVGKWGVGIGSPGLASVNTSGARTGSGSYACTTNFGMATKILPASGGFVVGVAFRLTSTPLVAEFVRIREGTTGHLSLHLTTGGLIEVKCGSTLLGTGTTVLSQNNWYYLEFKGVIHSTTGSYELRIDGMPELVNPGPAVTRNGGVTGQWDCVGLAGASATSTSWFDDLYVADASGAIRNDFLGAVRVETLMPQVGNGSNVGLTPSTGTDHGALVDEIPANTTDYNSSAAVGAKDTYNLPSLTLAGGVLGVQVTLYASKTDAGIRKVCGVLRVGGVDYDGADVSLLTSFKYHTGVRAQNPASSVDWTTADIAAMEVGMKVTV